MNSHLKIKKKGRKLLEYWMKWKKWRLKKTVMLFRRWIRTARLTTQVAKTQVQFTRWCPSWTIWKKKSPKKSPLFTIHCLSSQLNWHQNTRTRTSVIKVWTIRILSRWHRRSASVRKVIKVLPMSPKKLAKLPLISQSYHLIRPSL